MNKVMMIGHLTKNIEKKYLNQGTCVVEATIAVNENYKKKDGQKVTDVCFIEIVAYGNIAEVLYNFTKKGSKILVEGKLKQNTWQDNNSNTKSKYQILVEKIQLLDKKKDTENANDISMQDTQHSQMKTNLENPHSRISIDSMDSKEDTDYGNIPF